ncbi:MAG: O-antigen ligase family protein [Bryobacteraceae bacterium]
MLKRHPVLQRAPFYLTCGAAVSILFSIAVSQILIGLAFAALLLSGERMRFPPIKLPLGLYMLGTLISLLLCPNPALGTPQLRKFFVFLILLLVYSTYRTLEQVRWTVLLWGAVAALSALRSLFQFLSKYRQAAALHQNFYQYYVGSRITGFTSHWMTFGGEEMVVLMMLAAFVFLSPRKQWKSAAWICAVILALSMLLGLTRGIWLGTFVAGMYLFWIWRKWLALGVPVLLVLLVFVSPRAVRERVMSAFHPHGDTDSNEFRIVVWRAGFAMVRAHPWFGIGPEEVKPQIEKYIPADVPRPLPSGWYGHLHNIYLQYAASRGIPDALVFIWLLAKIGYDFIRAVRRKPNPDARFVLHGAIAVWIGILVVGFFEVNLGDSEVLTMFLSVVGCGYIAAES